MIDTHCHLDSPLFDPDRDEVMRRAHTEGVQALVVPAIRPSTWGNLSNLKGRHGNVFLALGIHPQAVPEVSSDELLAVDSLAEAISRTGAVAVGECGLDGSTSCKELQEKLFCAQIGVARELRLPLLVHVVKAHDVTPGLLKRERAFEVGGILHSYSGGASLLPYYQDLGFAFSLAGPVTYPGARRPLESARAVPAELLLAETDAPDQAPFPYRRQRSEPAFLREIVAGLARAREEEFALTATRVTENARRILRLPSF
ncbi:MAG: TatD family hydrolase [Deltaproteobacteria bacterium]|nr:TatD family hydrolase [Deltaproteobacteria bacterium]